MQCVHCSREFEATASQIRHFKYDKRPAYCSDLCRYTARSIRLYKPVPKWTCKKCGNEFSSKKEKFFCSLSCYTKSDQFKELSAANRKASLSPEIRDKVAQTLRTGETIQCQECGKDIYKKKSLSGKKFCSVVCSRSFFSKRFDRWIANPETLALPQNYDEFLDQEELPCIFEGCEWVGKHLSLHANSSHGVSRDEFKRVAGFNLHSGIVSKPLAETLRGRDLQGLAIDEKMRHAPWSEKTPLGRGRYISLEAREHQRKVRALVSHGPDRTCEGCGAVFTQETPFGRQVYCSVACRKKYANYR